MSETVTVSKKTLSEIIDGFKEVSKKLEVLTNDPDR